MKKSFLLYHDICECVEDLTDEQAGVLFKNIINYSSSKTHKNPQKPTGLTGLLKAVFHPFKCHIDRDFEVWEGKAEINRNNGKKGGRPKKTKTHKNPQKPVKVNVKVNGNGKDNDNVKEKRREVFKKPSIQEIHDYMNEYGNQKKISVDLQIEPEKMFDFYVANGWKVGKNAMKDWKASVRNWLRGKDKFKGKGDDDDFWKVDTSIKDFI